MIVHLKFTDGTYDYIYGIRAIHESPAVLALTLKPHEPGHKNRVFPMVGIREYNTTPEPDDP